MKRLRELARREKRAEQKDRLMVPVLAIEGRETEDIMKSLCRSRGFVQRWACAHGGDADVPRARQPHKGPYAICHMLNVAYRMQARPPYERAR